MTFAPAGIIMPLPKWSTAVVWQTTRSPAFSFLESSDLTSAVGKAPRIAESCLAEGSFCRGEDAAAAEPARGVGVAVCAWQSEIKSRTHALRIRTNRLTASPLIPGPLMTRVFPELAGIIEAGTGNIVSGEQCRASVPALSVTWWCESAGSNVAQPPDSAQPQKATLVSLQTEKPANDAGVFLITLLVP